MQYKLEQEIALWDPHNNEAATSDPYKSLFVSRINYDSSESKLRREFEIYGPIKKVCVCACVYLCVCVRTKQLNIHIGTSSQGINLTVTHQHR